MSLKVPEQHLVSLGLSLKGKQGVPEKQCAGLQEKSPLRAGAVVYIAQPPGLRRGGITLTLGLGTLLLTTITLP